MTGVDQHPATVERGQDSDGVLLNPRTYDPVDLDPESRRLLRATIEFFETRGKEALKERRPRARLVLGLPRLRRRASGIFATLLTPARDGGGDPDKRWDTARGSARSTRSPASTGSPTGTRGRSRSSASGRSGRAENEARARSAPRSCSTRARSSPSASPSRSTAPTSTRPTWCSTPTGRRRLPRQRRQVLHRQRQRGRDGLGLRPPRRHRGPGRLRLLRRRLASTRTTSWSRTSSTRRATSASSSSTTTRSRAEDILHTGQDAFDAALNTVNVGKFNLGFASIGICEHAFYEAITHADNRVLYGMRVTDFPHVRQALHRRLRAAGRDEAVRARARSTTSARPAPDDRRYLLFNPMTKMKVTTEGERVIDLLWDVIAAKGFEKDMYFEMAARDIRGLPKLEGTVHVNMALVLKFMAELPVQPRRVRAGRRRAATPPTTSSCSARARRAGLRKIRFHDWRAAYERVRATCRTSPASPSRPSRSSELLDDRAARRGPAEGPRLPAHARRAVHADRLRAADPASRPS